LGIDSEIVRGGGGIFDVTADTRKIFSKHDAGRFPSEAEILEALKGMVG